MNDKLIEFCQKMIQTESISGREQNMASLVAEEMRKLQYDEVRIDNHGNVIGRIKGSGGRSILFDGHMDTVGVPALEKWSVDPFAGTIIEGRLYGRGSADMKCALAAMIYGAAELIERKEALDGDILVCAVVFEETLEGVALGKILDTLMPDCIILGEPSNMKLAIGQKGRAEIVIETEGKNAHSATPDNGINAIDAMHRLVSEIKQTPVKQSPQLGKGIMEITDIVSAPYPGSSVVPNYCRATYDRRLIEGETEKSVLEPINAIIRKLKDGESSFGAAASIAYASEKGYTGTLIEASRFFPGWIMDEQSPLVRTVQKSYRKLGMECESFYYPFCTDGSESAGKRGIPTVGIGPAPSEMAHVVDEYVVINDIIMIKNLYREIAAAVLDQER